MPSSIPFLFAAVSNTPLLAFRNGTRLESLEVSNPNTVQVFIQLFDVATAAEAKVNVTFTVTAATDIVTSTAHGLVNNKKIRLLSTTALPAGLAINTDYWVINATTDTFQLAATPMGAAIDITGTGTGTHSFSNAVQSYIVPAGDGTNNGAVSKEFPKGVLYQNGLALCITTTQTGSTAPASSCGVNGTLI